MSLVIGANPVPLKMDPDGTIRVVGTRLTLDVIIGAFLDGATAEEIAERFPDLSLPDIYTIIGYYLRYRADIDSYLGARRQAAGLLRQTVEADPASEAIRTKLLARRAGK